MTRPPVFGMISMLTPAHEQGSTMGVAQGVGSLARIVGLFCHRHFRKESSRHSLSLLRGALFRDRLHHDALLDAAEKGGAGVTWVWRRASGATSAQSADLHQLD